MRLWHYKLLPYLPDSQLIAQKRECDLIWKDISNNKKTNHILINYIWTYSDYIERLAAYYELVKAEFERRKFTFNDKYLIFQFIYRHTIKGNPFPEHHNMRYLEQCFYNLQEKYDRGQKDFSWARYDDLDEYVMIMQASQEGWLK